MTAFAALGVAFYSSWKLTLVILASLPLAALVLSFVSARMQPNIDAQTEELSAATKTATTAISAIETVKCCNGQDHEVWQFRNAIARAAKFYRRQARANALQIGFVRLIILCMFVQGFWYGSTLLGSGGKDAGQILTTFWATLMATQTAEQILPQLIVLEKGKAAGAALKAIVQERPRTTQGAAAPDRGKRRTRCKGDIKFKHVGCSARRRPRPLMLMVAGFVLVPYATARYGAHRQ